MRSKLHEFDLRLCDYARGNLANCFPKRPKLKKQLERLKPEFKNYILNRRQISASSASKSGLSFLLNDEEIYELENIAHAVDPPMDWIPYQTLHKDATLCTGEINRRLAPSEGRRWASDSSRFIEKLESGPVYVAEGIAVIREWLEEIRRYKEAMGDKKWIPRPDGMFPTPNFSAPDDENGPDSDNPDDIDIQRMREVIATTEGKKPQPPKALIIAAKINEARGRKALRYLEEIGEYDGFSRAKSSRYSQQKDQ